MVRFGYKIDRTAIPSLFNAGYYSVLRIFNRYKRFGLPFTGGWAEQPGYIVDIIEAMLAVEEHAIAETRKQAAKSGNSRGAGRTDTRRGRTG